ncbi:MAG: FliH/SctL family protein, partial [Pontibacterium sp.]
MAFKGDHETRTRISSQEAPAVSPWSLPKVTGEHVVAIERKKSLEKKSPLAQQSKVPDSALVTPPPPPPESVVSLAEAESIREAAYQEGLLQGLSEGREKGYPEGVELGKEEGKKLGYEEAFKQGQAELEQSMANLALIMQDLQSPIAQQEQAYAESIRSLVIKLSQAVIQAELKAQPDVILAAVNTALA